MGAENDLEFVKECVDLFMETVDERLPELDASVQAGDDENTYVHAHFIGSSCGSVGAEAMLKAARATEHAAKDHDAQGVLDNYANLQEEYAKAKAWFTEKFP